MPESKYREALVTYIDILGFREMVKDSERTPSRIPELRYVLKVLKKQIGTGVRYSFERSEPKKSLKNSLSRFTRTWRLSTWDAKISKTSQKIKTTRIG